MRFLNKVVVITGGATGIGRSTALMFAQEGAKIAIGDVEKDGERVASKIVESGGMAVFIPTDVSLHGDCERLMKETVKTFGRIDILVNNAAIFMNADLLTTSGEAWRRIFDVNVLGVFNCSREAARFMVDARSGNIVHVASAGGIVALRNQLAYSSSKAAVIMMAKCMAVDLAPYNIRVNAICPGSVDTPILKKILSQSIDPVEARKAIERSRPANRIAEPREIASAILFLASDEASYVTGSSLIVDGGLTAW
jgi:dihydroanticapsin dehydrogenase